MAKFTHYEQCPRCLERGRDSRGDNCAVYSDGSRHCFSCHYHSFPKGYASRVEETKVNAKVLPTDFSREIPEHAARWLLQYQLPLSYWKPFIGWSEKDSRLVFTVGDGPEFSIGRYLPADDGRRRDRPATERQPRKWFVWGNSHRNPHLFGNYNTSNQVVLVEDVISAHKVGSVSSTICLFGTMVFDGIIPVLRHIGIPVVLWLDKDQEETMARKCMWIQAMTGLDVTFRVTKADPKSLSLIKIVEMLKT